MPEFTKTNSGINLYFSNSTCQSSSLNGKRRPEMGFHSTIERPESVNLVNPPTTTMQTIISKRIESHISTDLFVKNKLFDSNFSCCLDKVEELLSTSSKTKFLFTKLIFLISVIEGDN